MQAYRERALRWAARERLKRGQTLAPSKVCELAGLTATASIIGIAKKVALSMERRVVPTTGEDDCRKYPLIRNDDDHGASRCENIHD